MLTKTTSAAASFQQAYQSLMPRLENSLDPQLTYHNNLHTKEVLAAAQLLGKAEGLSDDEQLLLNTAALFHDSGFLLSNEDHEEKSCTLARQYLPQAGYNDAQVETICALIKATKLPHQPATHLQKILCDADLSYLSTPAYAQQAEALYRELNARGEVKNKTDWQNRQFHFVRNHNYFTNTARSKWSSGKAQTLHTLTQAYAHQHEHAHHNKRKAFMQDVFLMVLGALIAGFGLRGFIVPNHFFDGGVTGISLLVHEFYPHIHLGIITVVMNLPFVFAGFFVVNRRFVGRTFFSMLLLGACLLFIPYPTITSDKLLISIFGGAFLGLGSGLAMRAGAALDGIEVLALYTWKRTSFTIYEIILGINIVIFSIAALRFGMATALYSVLTYLAATRTIDYVVEGIQAYTGVTIISANSEVIKQRLVTELGRSITIYKGERGYLPGATNSGAPCDIIFTIITRLELRKLKNLVHQSDPAAFVFANSIRDASGGLIKNRHHEH